MKLQVLKGTKQEIAEAIRKIDGEISEVAVLIEEPVEPIQCDADEDIFKEMEPYMVQVGDFDDSREAIYTRLEGE